MATDSILTSTKKILGLDEDYDAFDTDITMHINSVLATLTQMGIGPGDGFMIEDATPTWDEFIGVDPKLNAVKSYVYLRVRMLFDPPATSFVISALQEQIREFEWRLNVQRETTQWVDPNEGETHNRTHDPLVIDGGVG